MSDVEEPKTQIAITEVGLSPATHTELFRLSELVSNSGLVPNGFRGKPADCFIAMASGLELGFSAIQALQSFHVVNGKLGLPYQTVIALINASGLCELFECGVTGEGDERHGWVRSHRIGRQNPSPSIHFTLADARKAKLFPASSPDKPWNRYTDDMLIAKAVSRSGNRDWPDVLKGHKVYEDLRDIEPDRVEVDVTPQRPLLTQSDHKDVDPARALLAGASQPDESPEKEAAPEADSSPVSQGQNPVAETQQADLENTAPTDPPEAGFGEEESPEPAPKPRKASERAAARAEALRAAESDDPPVEAQAPPEPEIVEPPQEEPDQQEELCTTRDKAEIWRRAMQRAGKHAAGGLIEPEQAQACALEMMTLALKGKGYDWDGSSQLDVFKKDRRSILARIDNAKVPAL